jgi:hypothetical protein
METDAGASGIQTWLFGSVRVTLTTGTIQTHRFPTSLSRMGSPAHAAGENRIGGHNNRSFLDHHDGTVRPRVISECGNTNNPGPLAYKACLMNQKDQNFSAHFTWHCSLHPTGQQIDPCSSGFASERPTVSPSRYGVVATATESLAEPEHACVCTLRWSLALSGGATD